MIRYLLFFFCIVIVFASCVPNKRIVYLQHPPEPKKGKVKNTDSLSRSYTVQFREYKLKPRDIISLRIASITPDEFDFVRKYEEQLGMIRKLIQYDQATKGSGTGNSNRGVPGVSGTPSGENDVLSALSLDRAQSGFVIDDNGEMELPYIGKVKLEGLTLTEAELHIKEKLKGYFETPVVRIQIINFHFTILGEVNKEGRYTVFDPNATVFDAIAIADNLTDYADRSKIKIVRTIGNEAKVFYINTLREDLLAQDAFYVQPNDVIIVPPLPARATKKYTVPAYSMALTAISTTLTMIVLIISLNN
jgi:polysaccharide biosynthesis/export protein